VSGAVRPFDRNPVIATQAVSNLNSSGAKCTFELLLSPDGRYAHKCTIQSHAYAWCTVLSRAFVAGD
jgi:hypothetical protein